MSYGRRVKNLEIERGEGEYYNQYQEQSFCCWQDFYYDFVGELFMES